MTIFFGKQLAHWARVQRNRVLRTQQITKLQDHGKLDEDLTDAQSTPAVTRGLLRPVSTRCALWLHGSLRGSRCPVAPQQMLNTERLREKCKFAPMSRPCKESGAHSKTRVPGGTRIWICTTGRRSCCASLCPIIAESLIKAILGAKCSMVRMSKRMSSKLHGIHSTPLIQR